VLAYQFPLPTILENAQKMIAGEVPPPIGRLIAKAPSTCLTLRGEQARGRQADYVTESLTRL
jgi:hypothetical protein